MTAAMSVRLSRDRAAFQVVCFLLKTGKCIKLTQECEDRLSASPFSDKCGLFPRKIRFDRESSGFQKLLLKF